VSARPQALVPWRAAAAFAGAVALLAAAPALFALSPYSRNLVTLAFLLVSGSVAWNWMGGFLGQVSFGHAAMFGVGGFVSALRLRGPYFSIATIGMGEAVRLVFTYWEDFTGGASGVSLPIDPGMKFRLYWWGLGLAALVVAATFVLRRSTFGLQLLAIKADVDAAGDVGVSATFYQDLVFAISGTVVGISGGLYASYFSFIEPNDMFGFDRSIAFVLMTVIGGVGTVLGPVLGAIVFVLLRQYLLASYPQLYLGLYGGLLILIILFEPLGMSGLLQRLARLVRRRLAAPAAGGVAP
jgi:branched-chain amino acid transport system permease protein